MKASARAAVSCARMAYDCGVMQASVVRQTPVQHAPPTTTRTVSSVTSVVTTTGMVARRRLPGLSFYPDSSADILYCEEGAHASTTNARSALQQLQDSYGAYESAEDNFLDG